MVSLSGFPLGAGTRTRYPFAAYEIVPPKRGETWVGGADRASGLGLSRVRRVGSSTFLTLNAQCAASGCSKYGKSCTHKLYYHVHLEESTEADKRKRKWVQYARLILFATVGLPDSPEAMDQYIVHHETYSWQRVGLPKKRLLADDDGTLQWQARRDHGHYHHGYSARTAKKRPASDQTSG